MIDYSPLWQTLKEKNLTTYWLIQQHGFSKGTLNSLKHNKNVTLNTIELLCQILQVPIQKIVEIKYTNNEE